MLESSSSAFDYFYNLDGLGSVSNLTNVKGTVEETYSYDAWGNALTATGKVGTQNKFRFTGQALDPGERSVFPEGEVLRSSRWALSEQRPVWGLARRPLSLNKYIYVNNDPTVLIDPKGLAPSWWLPLYTWLSGAGTDVAVNGNGANIPGDVVSGVVSSDLVPGVSAALGLALSGPNFAVPFVNGVNTVLTPGNAINTGQFCGIEGMDEYCPPKPSPTPPPSEGAPPTK